MRPSGTQDPFIHLSFFFIHTFSERYENLLCCIAYVPYIVPRERIFSKYLENNYEFVFYSLIMRS